MSRSVFVSGLVVAGAIAVPVIANGCGLADSSDLFAGNGQSGSGGQGAVSATQSASSSSSSSSSSAGGGAGGATSSSSSASSSSSSGSGAVVSCNGGLCQPGEICCFNTSHPADFCASSGPCGQGYIEIGCNGPEDCPGGVCCGDVDMNQDFIYLGISCKPTCPQSDTELQLCSQQSPTCPPGTNCQQSQYLDSGYLVCY